MAAQFSWAAAADVATGVAGAIASWGTASANRITAKANAEAANTVRKAQNEQRASALSLAATVRSMADDAILNNAGDSFGSATELIARSNEAALRGDVELGLKHSEEMGALLARASAAGVGGGSVQAVSYSMRLKHARLAERKDERDDEQRYELLKQRSGIMPAATSRLEISPLNANFDYSVTQDASGSRPNLALALMQGLLGKRESLQVALNSIPPNGDKDAYYRQMDTGQGSIRID